MTDPESPPASASPDSPKPAGFWESLSTEPPRKGDKLKAVLFGIGMALLIIALAWLFLRHNSQPID